MKHVTDFMIFINVVVGAYGFWRHMTNFTRKPQRTWRWIQLMNALTCGSLSLLYLLVLTGVSVQIEPDFEKWSALYVRPLLTLVIAVLAANGYYRSNFPQDECLDVHNCETVAQLISVIGEKNKALEELRQKVDLLENAEDSEHGQKDGVNNEHNC